MNPSAASVSILVNVMMIAFLVKTDKKKYFTPFSFLIKLTQIYRKNS